MRNCLGKLCAKRIIFRKYLPRNEYILRVVRFMHVNIRKQHQKHSKILNTYHDRKDQSYHDPHTLSSLVEDVRSKKNWNRSTLISGSFGNIVWQTTSKQLLWLLSNAQKSNVNCFGNLSSGAGLGKAGCGYHYKRNVM